jgi:hypothetical protein
MSAGDLTNLKISDDSVATPAATPAEQENDVAIKDDTFPTEAPAVDGADGGKTLHQVTQNISTVCTKAGYYYSRG